MSLRIGAYQVSYDFLISADQYSVGIVSFYDRSLSIVKAFGAMLNSSNEVLYVNGEERRSYMLKGSQYDNYIQPITFGKEKFYQAICINKEINKTMILFQKGREGQQFYDYLMKEYDLPLMKEWGNAMYQYAYDEGILLWSDAYQAVLKGQNSVTNEIPIGGESFKLDELSLYCVALTADGLNDMVRELFQRGDICIAKEKQQPLQFDNMDSYIRQYGQTLVKNLNDTIIPLRQLDGEVHDFTLKHMTLFPQQIAQINGDVALLEHTTYAILNHGMGTGKTIVSASVVESYFVRKWLRQNPKLTLKDAYASEDAVTYRVVVMCPGHLVEKWANEVRTEIPYAKVTVIREFSQLLEVRKKGSARTQKEWYVMSKDFGKLTYQVEPSPKKRRYNYLFEKVCADCGEKYLNEGHTCPECKSRNYKLERTSQKAEGMICPQCKNILLPYRRANLDPYAEKPTEPLDHMDFTSRTQANSRCYYCENELWVPHVELLGDSTKKVKWIRATHYANKTHKNTKTVWVHKDFKDEYFESIGEKPLNLMDTEIATGVRKYSPAEYIRKYLKGYFDIAVFDEVHELKGGSTGQGMAMHALVKASKKQIALTGTIAGGYATNLFYLLYRLEPRRMKAKGYEYADELKFAEKYGKIEKQYEYNGGSDDEEVYNTSCKGRQKGTPNMKPGISPLIYMDFLLDRTTNLDLSDMSKYLPKLKEYVIPVEPDDDYEQAAHSEYQRVIKALIQASKQKGNGGRGLLSTMLQFSLSYLDKPYGIAPILSPVTGQAIVEPKSFDNFKDIDEYDNLLSKEKELIRIVKKELAEGRNCFVYAEYTASPQTCVTYRLKEILEKYCDLKGKVAILESASPAAPKREAWIKQKAKKGIKVFITNPRCVATGLDFCFKIDGVSYNYPTIIFYQMGYSMFVVAQSSRRHYRLNQTKECRTYYMCFSRTAQQAAVSLIAEKQVSTSAIQGKFSTEGLAAMANGVDSRLKLAQSLSELDTFTGNGLQEMFDVLATDDDSDDTQYDKYKPMVLFRELVGESIAIEKTIGEAVIDTVDLWSMFDINSINRSITSSEMSVNVTRQTTETFGEKKKLRKKIEVVGQCSLF